MMSSRQEKQSSTQSDDVLSDNRTNESSAKGISTKVHVHVDNDFNSFLIYTTTWCIYYVWECCVHILCNQITQKKKA